ncbi:MAG: PEP-CTERM sorting domain-containing protein [Verrucomicrobiales bacterium]
MKIASIATLMGSLLAAHGASAAGYMTGFENPPFAPYDGVDPASGQIAGTDGWTINTPVVAVSFVVDSWDPDGSDPIPASQAAGLGGYFDTPGADANVDLSKQVALGLSSLVFAVDFAVIASTDLFPGQDSFGFSITSASFPEPLMRVAFEPPGGNGDLEIAWYDNAGNRNLITPESQDIFYNGTYNLSLEFAASGADVSFSGNLSGTNSEAFSGTLTGLSGALVDSIGADFDVIDDADNYLVFDNFMAVPEPQSAMLLLLSGSLCLLRRRR